MHLVSVEVEIKPGSLHCAIRRVRRSEREKKMRRLASVGMTGFVFWRTDELGQGSIVGPVGEKHQQGCRLSSGQTGAGVRATILL